MHLISLFFQIMFVSASFAAENLASTNQVVGKASKNGTILSKNRSILFSAI